MKIDLKPIEAQVVVVFGASSGIGRQAALDFAARGAKVVAAARGEAALQSLVEEIEAAGGEASYVVADAADFDQVKNVADECVSRHGRMDTWAHCAASIIFARAIDTTPAEFRRLIEVNLLGQIHGALAAIPYLKRAGGGALIHVSSVEGYRSAPLQSAYGASKHGIVGFLQSLRLELQHDNFPISVTEVVPSVINTPIWETGLNKTGRRIRGPIPPAYHPKVVADAILYAAENPVRDIGAGATGLAVRYAERLSPALSDRFTSWISYRGMTSNEPPLDVPHNLHDAVPASARIEGSLDGWTTEFDVCTWAATRPALVKRCLVAGGVLGALAVFGLWRRSAKA